MTQPDRILTSARAVLELAAENVLTASPSHAPRVWLLAGWDAANLFHITPDPALLDTIWGEAGPPSTAAHVWVAAGFMHRVNGRARPGDRVIA